MRLEVPRSRKYTYFIWIVNALVLLWIILNVTFGLKQHSCTLEYVETSENRGDWIAYWQSYCQVGAAYYLDPYFERRDWLGLINEMTPFGFLRTPQPANTEEKGAA